jgi:hypothetical protein
MSQEHQLSYFVSATDKTCSREEVTTAQQPMTLGCIRSEIYTFAQVGTLEKKKNPYLTSKGKAGQSMTFIGFNIFHSDVTSTQ